ncbi:hypothetical protein R6Q57_020934 [Mikania cordata]
MGNCQAVDNASFVLQTQNGRAERFYSPISAADIMKLHPGHYVALLLTTTYYSSLRRPPPTTTTDRPITTIQTPINVFVLLALSFSALPTILFLAMLIDSSPPKVMKGLNAKKNIKLNNHKNFEPSELARISGKSTNCEAAATRSNQSAKSSHQMKKSYKHQAAPANSKSSGSKPRGWHPSLNSISETSS